MASKPVLKTDYKGDSYSGKRKFKMTENSDGTVSFEDVTPYTQTGDDFSAATLNTFATAINESVDKNNVMTDLDEIYSNTSSEKVAGAIALKLMMEKSKETIKIPLSGQSGGEIKISGKDVNVSGGKCFILASIQMKTTSQRSTLIVTVDDTDSKIEATTLSTTFETVVAHGIIDLDEGSHEIGLKISGMASSIKAEVSAYGSAYITIVEL